MGDGILYDMVRTPEELGCVLNDTLDKYVRSATGVINNSFMPVLGHLEMISSNGNRRYFQTMYVDINSLREKGLISINNHETSSEFDIPADEKMIRNFYMQEIGSNLESTVEELGLFLLEVQGNGYRDQKLVDYFHNLISNMKKMTMASEYRLRKFGEKWMVDFDVTN